MLEKFKVNISTGPDESQPMITVIMSTRKPMHFKEFLNGLYVYDVKCDLSNNNSFIKQSSCHYLLVLTVKVNESKFTNREIRNAKLALDLHRKIGRPAYQSCLNMLENNLIRNCPIIAPNTKQAFSIYEKDVPSIKGKIQQASEVHVKDSKLLSLPDFIVKWHLDITLCIDIFYVNQISFFIQYQKSFNSGQKNTC